MNPFEYALGLFTIIMGLALADIGTCLHRLLRNFRTVAWDSRVVLIAALVLVELVRMWFAQWSVRDLPLVLTFPFYLAMFLQTLLLFLLAAAALPDDCTADCDLKAFYDSNRRYFWSLYTLFQLSYLGLWFYFGGRMNTVGDATAFDWFRVTAPPCLCLLLVFVGNRWLHLLGAGLLTGFYVAIYWGQALN
jgi:hypothetical protein